VNAARSVVSVSVVISVAVFIGAWLAVESRAQIAEKPSLVGAWTLNKDASDQGSDRNRGDDDRGRRQGGGYGRGGGFGRRGGYGGAGGGYGRGGGGAAVDPEQMARMRDAMRDIMNPPDRMTITQTDTMVILTTRDGRTTRLSPDGQKVKDDNTKIERKTKWDGGKLVSEISGAGPGKITQSYAVDPEHHQLHLTVQTEAGRSGQARTMTYVYDADER
jgi:hypothetical protein